MTEITCAKCGHVWDYEWPGSQEKANCPACGTNVFAGITCELCGGYVPCGTYGDGACESCGMAYEYGECQRMAPTPEQLALFRAALEEQK